MTENKGPVLIELEGDTPTPSPADAAPVLDETPPDGQAMQAVVSLATLRPSPLARWFWRLLVSLLALVVSVAAWEFVAGLFMRNAVLGYTAMGLLGMFVLVCLAILIREAAALARLKRLDGLHARVRQALAGNDPSAARALTDHLVGLYAGRKDMAWARERVAQAQTDAVDADTILETTERVLMAPLDAAARVEVEAAARQVATVTALVPLAMADVVAALTANLRMIRRIAEIYGGRSGLFGGWRLTRTVLAHLVATGAVALGDDLIGSVAGGGVLSRVSRRFGEGVINGALTARVGVAAIEVCRPLPFRALKRPSVTSLVQRALTGLFGRSQSKDT